MRKNISSYDNAQNNFYDTLIASSLIYRVKNIFNSQNKLESYANIQVPTMH